MLVEDRSDSVGFTDKKTCIEQVLTYSIVEERKFL